MEKLGGGGKKGRGRSKGFEALGDLQARLAATPGAIAEAAPVPAAAPERISERARPHSLSSSAVDESVSPQSVAEKAEWRDLRRRQPDGFVNSRKFWRMPDGAVYVENPRSVDLPGSIPVRIAHGGFHTFWNKETNTGETLYWNKDEDTFTDTDPTPEVRATEMKQRRTPREPNEAEKSDMSERQAAARERVRLMADSKVMSAEARAKFEEGIAKASNNNDRQALLRILKTLPDKEAKTVAAPEPKADAPEVTDRSVDNSAYTKERLMDAQQQLKTRLMALSIGADRFGDIGKRIVAATSAPEIRALSREIKGLEPARRASKEVAPNRDIGTVEVPKGAAIPNQEELEGLLRRLAIRKSPGGSPDATAPESPSTDNAQPRNVELRAAIDRTQSGGDDAALDLSRFRLVANSNLHHGRGDDWEAHYYEHPDRPGLKFSLEEVSQMRTGARASAEVVMRPPVTRETTETFVRNLSTKQARYKGLKPSSFREILASKEGERSLGDLLTTLDSRGADIIRRMNSGEMLDTEEVELLDYARYEYAYRMKMVDAVRGKLLTSDLDYVAQHDETLQAAFGLNGTARTTEMFKQALPQLAMLKPEAIERLYHATTNLEQLRDSLLVKKWERQIHTLCRETGTELEDFNLTFDVRTKESRKASKDALSEQFHNEYGAFMRVVDRVMPFSKRRADTVMRRAVVATDLMHMPGKVQQVGVELGALATVLRYTIVDNKEIWRALQQEAVRNETVALPSDAGPRTYKEAVAEQKKTPETAEAVVGNIIKRYNDTHERDWDHTPKNERKEYMDDIASTERNSVQQNSGGGWFARGLASLFNWLFDQNAEAAVNRPVRA